MSKRLGRIHFEGKCYEADTMAAWNGPGLFRLPDGRILEASPNWGMSNPPTPFNLRVSDDPSDTPGIVNVTLEGE